MPLRLILPLLRPPLDKNRRDRIKVREQTHSSGRSPKNKKKANEKSLRQEISKTYKKWLDEDVVYIITPEEKAAFKQLSNDEERDNFIEAFWQRRDPTPDTP